MNIKINSAWFFTALLCLMFSSPSGGTDIKKLNTQYGLLEARSSRSKKECGEHQSHPCSVVTLRGQVIAASYSAGINGFCPSADNPRLIELYTHMGGNIMPPGNYLIDVSSEGYCEVGDFSLAHALMDGSAVILQKSENINNMGDRVFGVYSYKFDCVAPRFIKKYTDFDTAVEDKKIYPDQYLADPVLRKPIVKIVGANKFFEFRHGMLVQDKVEKIEGRYIFGSGCTPHMCALSGAMFVLDRVTATAVAITFSRGDISGGKNDGITVYGNPGPPGSKKVEIIKYWAKKNDLKLTGYPFNMR
jgi:hypothetical protein